MSSNIKNCTYTVNGEGYYSEVTSEVGGAIIGVAWNFFQFGLWSSIAVLMLIVFAFSHSYVVLGFAFLFALLAGWSYYAMTVNANTIANAEKIAKESPSSRPCKDSATGKVYN